MGRPPKTAADEKPEPVRLTALKLAVQSYGSVVATGAEHNILIRARAFAKYLTGDADTQPE